MGLYFGHLPVSRIWSGSDAFSGWCNGEAVWFSDALTQWVRMTEQDRTVLLLYQGGSSFVTIPPLLDGCAVTELAPSALNYADAKMVIVPPTVTVIG